MGTGIVYAAIVAVWLAVLVPMWLRHHDERTEARSVDRFSRAMHTLSGEALASDRRPAGDKQYVVVPARPAQATVALASVSGSRQTRAATVASMSASGPASSSRGAPSSASSASASAFAPEGAARRRRAMMARRRRVLATLLAFTVVSGGLAVGALIPAWSVAVPGGLLAADLVALWWAGRQKARARQARAALHTGASRPAHGGTLRAPVAGARAAGESTAATTGTLPHGSRRQQDAHERGGHTADAGTSGGTVGVVGRDGSADSGGRPVDPGESADLGGSVGSGAQWHPIPVPLPSYVTKPRAPRTTRSIDFSAPETWEAVRAATRDHGAQAAATHDHGAQASEQTVAEQGAAGAEAADGQAAGVSPATPSGSAQQQGDETSQSTSGPDPLDRILERRRAVGG